MSDSVQLVCGVSIPRLGEQGRRSARPPTREAITVTVAGRPSARLVTAASQQWRSWDEIADLFNGPPDPSWETDRDRIDQTVRDPWATT